MTTFRVDRIFYKGTVARRINKFIETKDLKTAYDVTCKVAEFKKDFNDVLYELDENDESTVAYNIEWKDGVMNMVVFIIEQVKE